MTAAIDFAFTLDELRAAAAVVGAVVPATPQHHWPTLSARLDAEVVVKHENHAPTGAFKVRGGVVYFDELRRREPDCPGVVTATRGNHGQSIALAAGRAGLRATVVVPRRNSVEKNAAMRAYGAELVEAGDDFQEAREAAMAMAAERGLHPIRPISRELVLGVASYSLELFDASSTGEGLAIDVAYVPVGMGSGICGMIAARDALGIDTEIVGVVSSHAPAYALSFASGAVIEAPAETVLADGMACRIPDPDALATILAGVSRIVAVSDDEVADAMRAYFSDTHNVAEGAGAAPLAAATAERERLGGQRVALVLSGGNVDTPVFARVLAGRAVS